MDNADKITLERVSTEIKISFAKMTLEQIELARKIPQAPEMIREIRLNAQSVRDLINR